MNVNKFYIGFILMCSLLLAIISIGARPKSIEKEDRSKVITFSHKTHLMMDTECAECHKGAKESEKSSDNILPKMADCYACHDEKSTPCEKCHPEGSEPKPFDNPERELIYNHKYHIENAKMECKTCHQGLEEVDYANESEKAMPNMDLCFSCHNNGLEKAKLQTVNKSNLVASKN